MPNRLAGETSPYLLQHKDNPVDWYPWGEEAFARARSADKPIFLSVGYSACHWCHVMAHESFQDEQTAAFMNEHFVCIKVDREERPDVDSVYMRAVQAISGGGGWPMSVWLLPDGRPFYGGTYFPKTARYGTPSFTQVLERIDQAFHDSRAVVERNAGNLTRAIDQHIRLADGQTAGPVEPGLLEAAFQAIASQYDQKNGGFASQPKFPPGMTLEFLLRLYNRYGWQHALEMVRHTLDRMAWGGMHDQIGGGFHRYSVDAQWLVPHFEKMLYDNALLLRAYLNAYQVGGEARYLRVVDGIIGYLKREMLDPQGGFYSSQDADSKGVEGRFYVWSDDELRTALQSTVVDAVLDYWGVTAGPNFEGGHVLWVPEEPDKVAARHQMSVDALLAEVEMARASLLDRREERIKPERDDKILAAWNGLAISSLAQAARSLGRNDALEMASHAAEFILRKMFRDGRLMRSCRDGQARHDGYLEDYAFFIEGLTELYQSTFEKRWFEQAMALTGAMVDLFWDDEDGFYDTARDHEALFVRPQEVTDNAMPSAVSSAVAVLLRMAVLAGRQDWREIADRVLVHLAPAAGTYPLALSYLGSQLDFALGQPHEIALVGDPDSEDMRLLLEVIRRPYRPNQVVALRREGEEADDRIPLLAGRETIGGKATAYVCQNYVCQLPVTDPESLQQQLVVSRHN